MAPKAKVYDQAYFDHWYRGGGMGARGALQRQVQLAVAMAEYHLERPLRSVLDVGCGEGAWQPVLKRLRPDAHYLGFDSSTYAVQRHGRKRNLHFARFADFALLRPCPPADLVVCADVLHYLDVRELDRGLPGLAELTGGILCIPTFARGDTVVGDFHDFHRRPAAFYSRRLKALGLQPLGGHCWAAPGHILTAMERL